jgi:hypothetical protein
MKRIMAWAVLNQHTRLVAVPMLADGSQLMTGVVDTSKLITVIPAGGVWLDEGGSIVDGVIDPATKATDQAEWQEKKQAKESQQKKALDLLAANPDLNTAATLVLLAKHGISRSDKWVRQERVRGVVAK